MEFATGALGVLLPKLAELFKEEYSLHKCAKKDIEYLSTELESMHAALRSIAEVPPEQLNGLVKIWARDVRELSYDMEDILDTFIMRIQGPEPPSKRNTKRFIKKMTHKVIKAMTRRGISQEIKEIKERVKEVAERRDRYKVDAAATTTKTTSIDPRITALYTKTCDLVGIDESRKELITKLTKKDGQSAEQRIVSIVGFGGLGKTTLAKAVYDKIKSQYNCMAFVSVSRNPDMAKIFIDLLYELDKTKHSNIHNITMGQKQLIDEVQEFLQNKRYLIVIDDIWDIDQWEIIRCALPENNLNSRIITTTRILSVAEHVGGCYKLKALNHMSSRTLFYGRIYGSEENCPQQFFDVSEKFLKKCGGVPLAIVTTSSLLANRSRNIKEWYDVCDSIGSGLGKEPGMDNMRKILLLSYYHLTPQLKTCLLYLSIFPEDYLIGTDRLIFRWIAEGFVEHEEGKRSLFEIGQSYLNELLNRSLIQPSNMDVDDMSSFLCRMHDMVLDLICSLSKEECFATTLSGDCRQISSSSLESNVRRLSLHNNTWPKMNKSKLRSLTIISSAIINSIPTANTCYTLLRVLDPSIEFVGKLFHLRYLSLANSRYAGKVPAEIGKLQFLQTLDLGGTDIKELPLSILGLRRLLCLCTGESTKLPNGLRNLSSLEGLRMSVESACTAEELGHLTQLRVIVVTFRNDKEGRWDETMCKALVGSLGKLHKIQTLGVFSGGMAADLEGSVEPLCSTCHLCISQTSRLPTWIDPASFFLLSLLNITVGQVQREDIQVLGKLQALCLLKIEVAGGRQVFERFVIGADAFPCLTWCTFNGFPMVPSMLRPGAMPRIQYFEFHIQSEDFRGGEIVVDDLALGHLPSLESIRALILGEETLSQEMMTEVEETLGHQSRAHPNHPDIYIRTDDVWVQL